VALLPTLAVLGFLVLVWAATTGPVGVISGSDRRFGPHTQPALPTPSGQADPGNLREVTKDVRQTMDLAWLGTVVVTLMYVAVAVAVFLAARAAWRRRWRPPERPRDADFEVLPTTVARRLAEERATQLAAVEQGDVRDGIVACWLRLEEAVAAAGVRPGVAETSTELVSRVLHSLDVDPRAVATLAALYREARFSEHPMGEDARAAARASLTRLHEDLRASVTA
jgi:hypothetical protein